MISLLLFCTTLSLTQRTLDWAVMSVFIRKIVQVGCLYLLCTFTADDDGGHHHTIISPQSIHLSAPEYVYTPSQHLRTHFNYMFCIIILFFLSFSPMAILFFCFTTDDIHRKSDGLSKSRQRSIKLAPHCSMKCTTFRFQSRRRECTQWPIAIANNCASSWWILRGASCEETWAGLFAVYVGRRLLLLPILLSVHDDILWVYSQKGCFGIRVLEQSKRDNKSRISYLEGHFSTTASSLCHCASITVSNSVLILKTKG